MTWHITGEKMAQRFKKKHFVAFLSSFKRTYRKKNGFKFIAIMTSFVEKWPLFSRPIIPGNTKDIEKLKRKKINVFCTIYE